MQLSLESQIRDHSFDFDTVTDLFQEETITDSALLTALSVASSKIFLKNKTVAQSIVIGANDITLDGQASGSAVDGTLQTDVIVYRGTRNCG